jgi:hypothetical protein
MTTVSTDAIQTSPLWNPDLAPTTPARRTSTAYHMASLWISIIGVCARGAHFWDRQVSIDGFPIAMDRRVLARFGGTPLPVTALRATFLSAEVESAARELSSRRLSSGRSFRFPRRIAIAMNGAINLENPAGVPLFRSVISVWPSVSHV